jgi:hypothetical protein
MTMSGNGDRIATTHGLMRGTAAVLWRGAVLSYFSPVHHRWSRYGAVAVTMLMRRRAERRSRG